MRLAYIENKDKIQVELNLLIAERERLTHKLTYEIRALNNKIDKKKDELADASKKKDVTVTNHAVQRFKERVMSLSDTKIRSILLEAELLRTYEIYGAGRYPLVSMPHVLVAISDYKIITVINTDDLELRLSLLPEWIVYYTEHKIRKRLGETVGNRMGFSKWVRHYIKNNQPHKSD